MPPWISRIGYTAKRFLSHKGVIGVAALLALTPGKAFASTVCPWWMWLSLGTAGPCASTEIIKWGGGKIFSRAAQGVIGTVVEVLTYILYGLAAFFGMLVGLIGGFMKPFIYQSNRITQIPEIAGMWSNMRDLSNALLILVLLAAAILVIIRYEKGNYTVKMVLPKVVTAVLLINFSKLIVQVVVDAFHVLTTGTYQLLAGNSATEETAFESLFEGLKIFQLIATIQAENTVLEAGHPLVNAQLLVASLFVVVLMFTILVAAVSVFILYVARLIALGLLTIFAPLAMLAGILPQTQQFAKKFWTYLIKYAAMPLILAAFFAFAMRLSSFFLEVGKAVQAQYDGAAFESSRQGMPEIEWSTLVNIIIVLLLVRMGVKMAKDGSFAEGAVTATENFANKWGKKAAGGIGKAAKYGAMNTPVVPTIKRNADGSIAGLGVRSARSTVGGAKKMLASMKAQRDRDQEVKDNEAASDFYRTLLPSNPQAKAEGMRKLMGVKRGAESQFSGAVDAALEKDARDELKDMQKPLFIKKVAELEKNGVKTKEDFARLKVIQERLRDDVFNSKDIKDMNVKSLLAQGDDYIDNKLGGDIYAKGRMNEIQKLAGYKNPYLAFQDETDDMTGVKRLKRAGDMVLEDPDAAATLSLPQFMELDPDDRLALLSARKVSPMFVETLLKDRTRALSMKGVKIHELLDRLKADYGEEGRGYTQLANTPAEDVMIRMGNFAPDAAELEPRMEAYREERKKDGTKDNVSIGGFLQPGDAGARALAVNFTDPTIAALIPELKDKAGHHLNLRSAQGRQVLDRIVEIYEAQLLAKVAATPPDAALVDGVRAELEQEAMQRLGVGGTSADPTAVAADVASKLDERVLARRTAGARAEAASVKSTAYNRRSVTILNKDRKGREASHILTHEANHGAIEKLGRGNINAYAGMLSPDFRNAMRSKLAALQDVSGMEDEEVYEEYFAEALANLGVNREENGVTFDDGPQTTAFLRRILLDLSERDPRAFYSTLRGMEVKEPARHAALLSDARLSAAYQRELTQRNIAARAAAEDLARKARSTT